MALLVFTGEDVTIAVAVRNRDRNVVDLSGASIISMAIRRNSAVVATSSITDAVSGLYSIIFDEDDLTAGKWNLQSQVTIGATTRVVMSTTMIVFDGATESVEDDWILANGVWNDLGVWDDGAVWIDA